MRPLLTALLLTGLFFGLAQNRALACSCVAPDAEQMLSTSDFAFVGTLVDKRPAGQGEFGGEAVYTFSVEGWAKGNLGETVDVRSADNGAACGYELGLGTEAALFVSKSNGALHGGLCSTMDAASLEAVAVINPPVATDAPGDTPPPVTVPIGDPDTSGLNRGPILLIGGSALLLAATAFTLKRRTG